METISTIDLAQRCREESQRFRCDITHDGGHCFELFRRAIMSRDQEAWDAVYEQYHRLVRKYLRASPSQVDGQVNQAFEKFWKSTTPETFTQKFSGIGKVIAYLRACARSVSIDAYRREEKYQHFNALAGEIWAEETATNYTQPIDPLICQELWTRINHRLKDEHERIVIYASFQIGLKPSQIALEYSDKFADVADVWRIKERVVWRLSHDPQLQAWWKGEIHLGKNC